MTSNTIKLNIYIIHSPTFAAARKKNCMQFLQELGKHPKCQHIQTVAKFVEVFEPVEITKQELKVATNLDKTGNAMFDSVLKTLHIRNISNAFKHAQAFKEIAITSDDDAVNMIIEDDILYGVNVFENLATVLESYPKNADFIFLGLPMANNATNNTFIPFSDMYNIAPTCESYLISKAFACHLSAHMLPIKFTTNVQLSFKMQDRPNVYVTKPNLFIDGSKYGAFPSTVEVNNMLFMNPVYHKLQEIAKKEIVTEEDELNFERLFKQSNVSGHPDMVFLLAIVKRKRGKITESKKMHDNVYANLKEHHGVFSNESEFLKSYIDLFRLTQSI